MNSRTRAKLPELDIQPLTGGDMKAFRDERNISQKDLGELLNAKQSAISRWENDRGMWNPIIMRLALIGLALMLQEAHASSEEPEPRIAAVG